MDSSIMSSEGIICSEVEDVKLSRESIWSYLYPRHQQYRNLTAFVSTTSNKSYTYQELTDCSLRFAKELEKYVKYNSGDAVAVIMPNNIEYPIVELGTFAIGAAVCLIRHDFSTDIALDILKDVNPKVLVIDSTLIEKFKVMFNQLNLLRIFIRGSNEMFPEGENLESLIYSKNKGLDVEKALKVDPETIMVVTCSSGTTGKPKAILLNQGNFVNSVVCLTQKSVYPVKNSENGNQDIMLAHMPNAHIFCIYYYTIAATSVGCKILDLDSDSKLSLLVDVVERFKPRILTFRAYMVDELANMENINGKLGSVDVIINVGCPLNPEAAKHLKKETGKDIFFSDVYGTSEIGPVIVSPIDKERLGATGKLMPNVKVRILDLSTETPILKPFTQGELQIKSPGVMDGYLYNPEATKEAFDGDWYRTGDVSYFDDEYYFFVIERFKDVISFRGKKILPSDIENIIKKHAAVTDVGVAGVPDPITREEIPKAFIKRNRSVSEKEIIEFVKKNSQKEEMWLCLKVNFVDSLPRNHLGKMVRKVLREMDWSGASSF